MAEATPEPAADPRPRRTVAVPVPNVATLLAVLALVIAIAALVVGSIALSRGGERDHRDCAKELVAGGMRDAHPCFRLLRGHGPLNQQGFRYGGPQGSQNGPPRPGESVPGFGGPYRPGEDSNQPGSTLPGQAPTETAPSG